MAKNVLDNCKRYIRFYYTDDGKWISNPNHKFNGHEVAPEAIQFAEDLFHFLIEGNLLNEWSKAWLTTNVSSMREMVIMHNDQVREIDRWEVHQTESKIDYCKRKLKEYFRVSVLDDVFAYPDRWLEANKATLEVLQRKYMVDAEYMDSIRIKIPKDNIVKKLDDNEWALLKQVLSLYSAREIRLVESGHHPVYSDKLFGYFNYIISARQLSNLNHRRLMEVRNILGLDDPVKDAFEKQNANTTEANENTVNEAADIETENTGDIENTEKA